MSEFKLSSYQEKILDFVQNNNGNLLVDAKAGSGKTSTLLLIAKEIAKQDKKCLFLAFNKSIVEELSLKINSTNCEIKTVHALGLSFLRSYLYRKYGKDYELVIDNEKLRQLVKEDYEENFQKKVIAANFDLSEDDLKQLHSDMVSDLCKLINFSRFYNVDYHNEMALHSLLYRCSDLLQDANMNGMQDYQQLVERVIEKTKYLFENPPLRDDGTPVISVDFTDMIYFPTYYRMFAPASIKQYLDYVLVDESQDLSILQQLFLKRVTNGNTRYIFVGDEKQAIYGFAGADTNSINNIKRNFSLTELPLNICYRCPENVIRLSQTLVPSIEWNKAREDQGVVELIKENEFLELLKPGDIIIGRRNKDLVALYKKLVLEDHISVKFKNKDLVNKLVKEIEQTIKDYIRRYNRGENIEKNLHNFFKKANISENKEDRTKEQQSAVNQKVKELINSNRMARKNITKSNFSISYLKTCMKDYKDNGEYSYNSETDMTQYFEIIESFINEYTETYNSITVKTLIDYTSKFLSGNLDANVPILSTIHMMKGGESDNVFIIDYPRFPYVFKNQDDDDKQQEKNLQYVALTRAKKKLYLLLIPNPTLDDKITEMNTDAERIIKTSLMK